MKFCVSHCIASEDSGFGCDAVSSEWFVLFDRTVVCLYSWVNMFMISAMDLLALENEGTVTP